jgi:rare lipoprotein A
MSDEGERQTNRPDLPNVRARGKVARMIRRQVLAVVLLAGVAALLAGCASTPEVFHSGETQRGMASWYGAEQDGGRTASGERFNMHALTAAHRHFPFGTIVRVTNLQNDRSVDVRINDRGPWTGGGRIIDVSSAAADALEMKRAGLVPVELEILQIGSGKRTGND